MGTEETLAAQLAYVDVLFHFHKPAKSFFDRVLMNFEWLLDEDAAFHLPFNQVYFCVGAALERLHSVEHSGVPATNWCKHRAMMSLAEWKPVV